MLPLLLTKTPLYDAPKKLIADENPSETPVVPVVGNDFSSPMPRLDNENDASGRTADINSRDSSDSRPDAAEARASAGARPVAELRPVLRPARPDLRRDAACESFE